MLRVWSIGMVLGILFVGQGYAQTPSDSTGGQKDYSYAYDESSKESSDYGDGENLIRGGWHLDFAMSTVGFNLGGGYDRKIAPSSYVGINASFFWVRGNNEAQFFYSTINNEDIILFPAYVYLKRRVLNNAVSSSFRPYVSAGVGGVHGIFVSGDTKTADHRDTMLSGAGFGALGADFGTPGTRTFGFELKYEVIRFPHNLGERDKFDNFQVKFYFLFN